MNPPVCYTESLEELSTPEDRHIYIYQVDVSISPPPIQHVDFFWALFWSIKYDTFNHDFQS